MSCFPVKVCYIFSSQTLIKRKKDNGMIGNHSLLTSRDFFQKIDITINDKISDIEDFLSKNYMIDNEQRYADFLCGNKIISPSEDYFDLVLRTVRALAFAHKFNLAPSKNAFALAAAKLIAEFKVVLSTPIYTNSGRAGHAFSACAIPPISFSRDSFCDIKKQIADYHEKGMGTGFNFDDAADPVAALEILNKFAVVESEKGILDRPVGNMGIISVDHPGVIAFSSVKENAAKDWKFNLSVNVSAQFMSALKAGATYENLAGERVEPEFLLKKFAKSAYNCGDPGLVFMHRHELSNKAPHLGKYVSLAPCGEAPLLSGEVCQFGYLNLFEFLKNDESDYAELKKAVHVLVNLLDNTVELNIASLLNDESKGIIYKTRKIGVGVCGFSDLLFFLGIPYSSQQAVALAEELLSFINLESKKASVELSKLRGCFPAFNDPMTKRELIIGQYIDRHTNTVSRNEWLKLQHEIERHGIRNISTIILPPTGRSSLVAGASASIEPPFKLVLDKKLKRSLEKNAKKFECENKLHEAFHEIKLSGSLGKSSLPLKFKEIYKTCLELTPKEHLQMVAAFQRFTDEAISKTINLPQNCSIDDIMQSFILAYDFGLKGITVFRNNSLNDQPKRLMSEEYH
jgi:ribonucleoside-diphosphate reductase alpha chain